jgi:hypothetical protein
VAVAGVEEGEVGGSNTAREVARRRCRGGGAASWGCASGSLRKWNETEK